MGDVIGISPISYIKLKKTARIASAAIILEPLFELAFVRAAWRLPSWVDELSFAFMKTNSLETALLRLCYNCDNNKVGISNSNYSLAWFIH